MTLSRLRVIVIPPKFLPTWNPRMGPSVETGSLQVSLNEDTLDSGHPDPVTAVLTRSRVKAQREGHRTG